MEEAGEHGFICLFSWLGIEHGNEENERDKENRERAEVGGSMLRTQKDIILWNCGAIHYHYHSYLTKVSNQSISARTD